MKTFRYSYYLSDFLHCGLIDAENEADCIVRILNQLYHPELMRGLMVEPYNEPLLPLVSKNSELREKIKEYEEIIRDYGACIDHYEARDLELSAKIDELDAQLLQYQVYVSDLTTAIQKNICKDFLPNIGQPK